MNHEQCLSYLEQVQHLGMKFGLDNVRTVLAALGNPERCYPGILVGGTNGKGSVCAMLTRILTLHGYRAGLYTSPHLVKPEERIRIGHEPISEADFARHLTRLKETIDHLIAAGKLPNPPTYFETMTCLAYLYFAAQKVDMAVLEVGMGGRFDATNVIDPVLSVITTISLEHQKFLGSTLSQIAFEKAGIMKPGVPVICGVEAPKALETLKARAAEKGAPFISVFEEGTLSSRAHESLYTFKYKRGKKHYAFTPSLAGLHQGRNAAVVLKAAEALSANWRKLEKRLLLKGIESTRWEGRLEVVSRHPLIIMDGAHNVEGAKALRRYVDAFLPKPITLVYAAMRDKDVARIAEILFPAVDRIILTRFPFRKAADPEELKKRIPLAFHPRLTLEPNPFTAIKRGQLIKRGQFTYSPNKRGQATISSLRGTLLIAGSLFLVGEAKKYFTQHPPDPAPSSA